MNELTYNPPIRENYPSPVVPIILHSAILIGALVIARRGLR